MALLFKPTQSRLSNKNGEKLFYPQLIRVATIGTHQIAKEIARRSSLSRGDVKNVSENLIDVMKEHLQASEHVNLEGFGIFRMAITSRGSCVNTPEDVSLSQATTTVRFRPSSKRNFDRTLPWRAMTEEIVAKKVIR